MSETIRPIGQGTDLSELTFKEINDWRKQEFLSVILPIVHYVSSLEDLPPEFKERYRRYFRIALYRDTLLLKEIYGAQERSDKWLEEHKIVE